MRVEPDEHEFMLECGHEIVISSILAVFVIVLMCVFVCFDSQYCIVYQYAVVDASTVNLVQSEHHFGMCKPLECHVDRRAHSVFWSYCTKCCWGAHLRFRSFHYHNHLFPPLVVVL